MIPIRPLLALIAFIAIAVPATAQPMRLPTTSAPADQPIDFGTGSPGSEAVLNVLFKGAMRTLEARGAFYPSAVAIDTTGTVNAIFPFREGMSVQSLVDTSIAMLKTGVRSGEFIQTGMLLDVHATPPGESAQTDAMMVQLESKGGAVLYYQAYRIVEGKVVYGASWIQYTVPTIFTE